MSSFAHSCLINAALSALLGLFTLFSSRKKEALYWSLYSITVAMWSAGLGLMVASKSFPEAFFWLRWLHYLGAIMIPIFFFHFATCYVKKKSPRLIVSGYALAVFQQILSIAGGLATVEPLAPFNFYTVPKPAYVLFVAYFFFYVFYAHLLLFQKMRSSTDIAKKHLQYIFFGTSLAFCGGSTAFFPVFHWPVFPYGVYAVFVYILTVTYAILHDQLLDIRLVLRDTTLHAATIVMLGGAAILVGMPLVATYPTSGIVVSTTIMGLLMAFAYDPIRKALQPAIDRIVFSNRFGYLEELSQLPNDILEFTNLREMLKFLVIRLVEAGHLEHAAVLMYDPGFQSYVATMSHSAKPTNAEPSPADAQWRIARARPLVELLKSRKRLLIKEELVASSNPEASEALSDLVQLKAAACFGASMDGQLVAFVSLGPKQNGESFNQRDLKILEALKLRLENFLLQAMVTTQESLNMVKDSHDMKNGINALVARLNWRGHTIKTFEKKWLTLAGEWKGKVPDPFLMEVSQEIEKFNIESKKTLPVEADVLQNLKSKLQNWSEYGRLVSQGFKGNRALEPIDVSSAARRSLDRWELIAQRKGIELLFESEENLQVLGEKSLIEQIVENLIDNALKATEKGRVSVRCRATGDRIIVEVEDTGCGIPKEDIGLIFKKPFYQGKGRETLEKSTGIGLFLVWQYAKSLDGDVQAESTEGRGSTFRVLWPSLQAAQIKSRRESSDAA